MNNTPSLTTTAPYSEPVFLELDRKRELRLNFLALAEIERATGKNTLNGEFFNDLNAQDLITAIHCCLKQEDPELTWEQTGILLGAEKIFEARRALNALIKAAYPKAAENLTPTDDKGKGGDQNGKRPLRGKK